MIKKFNRYLNTYISETAISAVRNEYSTIRMEDGSYEDTRTKCYDFKIAHVTKKKSKLIDYSYLEMLPYDVIGTVIPEKDKIVYTFIVGERYRERTVVIKINNFSDKIKLPYSLDDELLQHITENKKLLENIICKIFNIDSMTDFKISYEALENMPQEGLIVNANKTF